MNEKKLEHFDFKKYVIRGLGEFFDGLVVHCQEFNKDESNLVLINRIEQSSKLLESFSLPVNGGMYIHSSKLEEYKEIDVDFQTDNPFGAYRSQLRIERDNITLLLSFYSNAVVVGIKNINKTILSRNVFDKDIITKVRDYFYMMLEDDSHDILDSVFELREICDG